MSSDVQIQANQQNGKLGGVKTDQGKAVTKFNALQHGILRQTLTEYEKDFYLEIYADLVRQYQPVTLFEKILIERITVHYLKLFRIQKAETEYMKATLDPHLSQSRGFPNLNELMTEEVINEIERKRVRYLLWSNRSFTEYGVPTFGRDYETAFAGYLTSHYRPVGPLVANTDPGWAAVVWERLIDENAVDQHGKVQHPDHRRHGDEEHP